ncbi:hypothetical protein [Nostoc sp.]
MKKITKFLDITLWVLVGLGIVGGGFSAYVASSFWAGGNGRERETTIYPDRLDRDASDRNSNQLSLDGERATEAGNPKQGIR